jgi:carbon monoxide dehydrogenase subunit G
MKFSASQDIALPAAQVFSRITDFEAFEHLALRRDIVVDRRDHLPQAGVGSSWEVDFAYRGKPRHLLLEVTEMRVDELLALAGRIGGFDLNVAMTTRDAGPGRSRLEVEMDVKPRSLSARFLLNSIRFGKRGLERRFARRIADFGRALERWQRSGASPWR